MVTQLLLILDEWTEALELGGRVDVIYIYIHRESTRSTAVARDGRPYWPSR